MEAEQGVRGVILNDSVLESAQYLPDRQRLAFIGACCEYVFYGREPDLPREGMGQFVACRHSLNTTRARMAAGKSKSEASSNQTRSKSANKTESNAEQTANKPEANSETKSASVKQGQGQGKEKERRSGRPDRRAAEVGEVIDYLNAKTGRQFRPVEANARHVRARLNEGYTVEDCKRVVDLKAGEWLGGEASDGRDMSVYLRPETLFGSKFDSYLNSAPTSGPRRGPRISLVTGEPLPEDGPSPVRWGDAL